MRGDTDQPKPTVLPSGAVEPMLCDPIWLMSDSGWIGFALMTPTAPRSKTARR